MSDVWIEPLSSKMPDGKPYQRPAYVEAAIAEGLQMTQAQKLANLRRWPSETVFHFTLHAPRADEEAYGEMFVELGRRATRTAFSCVRGMQKDTAKEIIKEAEHRVFVLVSTKQPSRARDILEVTFAEAVEHYTFDRMKSHLRSNLGGKAYFQQLKDEDGIEIERPIELIPGTDPGAEVQLLNLKERNLRHQLLRIACQAVPDRMVLRALILHHGYGWPVMSTDGNIPCLCRHFGVPERSMYRLLADGMAAMRKALHVEVRQKGAGR